MQQVLPVCEIVNSVSNSDICGVPVEKPARGYHVPVELLLIKARISDLTVPTAERRLRWHSDKNRQIVAFHLTPNFRHTSLSGKAEEREDGR